MNTPTTQEADHAPKAIRESSSVELSIIIVNWNSKDYVRKCVQTIYANTSAIAFEIIVVDGASYDGCGEMLAREFPEVRFFQGEKNIGFARANNLAFAQSRGNSALFLNPDTELVGPAINELYDTLIKFDDAGAIGARLLNSDMSIQTNGVQSIPTILNQIFDTELLKDLFPKSRFCGAAVVLATGDTPREVEVLSGACIMARRQVFEKAGMFCADYFMYAEDADLCYQIKKNGYKIYYVPKALIVHHGGGSSQQPGSDISNAIMRESIWLFLTKTKGRLYAAGYRVSMMLCATCRLCLLALALPIRAIQGEMASTLKSFRKWMAIFIWSVGAQAKTKDSND